MRRFSCLALLAASVLIGTDGSSAGAAEADSVAPIDTASGRTLVRPEDSALAEDVPNGPPNPQPPPYTLLRFTESYAYLADPAQRTDFFDPVKYIPLDDGDPDSYLSLGGEIRERFEAYRNQGFGTAPGFHHNAYLLQRLALNADLHVNRRLRFFVQGISGLQDGGFTKPATNQDPINLQQALVDYTFGEPTLEGDRLTLRAGRFEMTYGAGRLVATRAAPNIPFKFDGAQFIASSGNSSKLYGFFTHPVIESTATFDRSTYRQEFWGFYGTTPLGSGTKIDAYYLSYRNDDARFADAAGREERYTVGARLSGSLDAWDYDVEGVYQFGSIGPKDIGAWTFSTDAGYNLKAAAWKPRFGAKFDVASGDGRRGDGTVGTFNPLYFKSGYFNDASLFRPSNMIDVHPNLQFQPTGVTTVTLGSDVVWRYSDQDGLYGPSGAMSLPASAGSHYVGTTAEAAIQYRFDRHLTLTASYVHMFTGHYVEAARGGDVDYVGTWLSYLW